MKTEDSDRYFELQERARKLASRSATIAAAFRGCSFCFGSGSVSAVNHKVIDGRAVRVMLDPPVLLPCVCTAGWPYFKQGGEGAD